MDYFMLSVWEQNGKISHSFCCSVSRKKEDLIYNMKLYNIRENEYYVICKIADGLGILQGGQVEQVTCYDCNRQELDVFLIKPQILVITGKISNILAEQQAHNIFDYVSDGYDNEEYREETVKVLQSALLKNKELIPVFTALCERIEELEN